MIPLVTGCFNFLPTDSGSRVVSLLHPFWSHGKDTEAPLILQKKGNIHKGSECWKMFQTHQSDKEKKNYMKRERKRWSVLPENRQLSLDSWKHCSQLFWPIVLHPPAPGARAQIARGPAAALQKLQLLTAEVEKTHSANKRKKKKNIFLLAFSSMSDRQREKTHRTVRLDFTKVNRKPGTSLSS